MTKYFFDLFDNTVVRDEVGVECASLDAMRREARRTLPAIAKDVLPADGDQHTITVLVRDERGALVYTATLAYMGLLLAESAGADSTVITSPTP